jgi:hypothetical protein
MDRMRTTLAALAFAAFAGLGLAATPSRQQALDAISVLEKNLTGPQATEAAKTVVVYAQLSDDVMVDIGPEQLPWISTEEWGLDKDRELSLQSLLVAAFVAGDVKSQLKNEKAEDDTYSGWLFAIATYRLQAQGGRGFPEPVDRGRSPRCRPRGSSASMRRTSTPTRKRTPLTRRRSRWRDPGQARGLKLRHLSSGRLASAISASWLATKALSHQNAASVNP